MAVYKAEGIVLRARNLGEADKILTLFTPARGKVEAVARGARRARSRLMGATQLFTHGRYLLFEGKELDSLSQGEIIHSFRPLREDLERMAHASYAVELVDRSTEPGDRHDRLFLLLSAVLGLLATGSDLALVSRYFELRLLEELGYRPHLSSCIRCGAADIAAFSIELGGLVCPRCRVNDPGAVDVGEESVSVMRYLQRAEPERLAVVRPSNAALQTMEDILPKFCAARIGRPMQSLEFLMSIRAADG
ncbi:MAG: DNA repair protein RecO [Firmicutes bacterium]|nr:DNA repair protein RecO [Bacillota bacterium]